MTTTHPIPRFAALLAASLLVSCTASRPPETAALPSTDEATAAAAKWEDLDAARLRAYVAEQARLRLAEAQSELDLSQLDAYRRAPASAPLLKGKAVDRLFDLAVVALTEGRLNESEGLVRLARARAANRNMAFAGTTLLSEIARRRAGEDPQAQIEAIAAVLRELPRTRLAPSTVVFRIFQKPEQLTARIDETKTQMVSLDTAGSLLTYSQFLPEIVTHRERFIAAIERVEKEPAPAQADYSFATVDLTGATDASPVVIGVWDLGVQPSLFSSQLFSNPGEQPNGLDDDGNGQIDDLHGLASDGQAPNTALLFDPGEAVVRQYAPYLQGIMDLRVGMATTESAQKVLEYMKGIESKEALEESNKGFDGVGEWAHGTHVAGIALAGNPFARLAIFRSAWAGESRLYYHRGPTDEELEAERENMRAVAAFIRKHGVRVVNASLGFTEDYVEGELRYEKEKYANEGQIRARARAVVAKRRANWREVFEACPQTLFVLSAGNSNRDVLEYGDTPADLAQPNVLPVGAVDRWGGWATFTNSNPEQVKVFDFGVAVDSFIPNGQRLPLSGTSMAAPNVANLAGKMLAVAPGMAPAEVIRVILETGDPIAAPFDGVIANEVKAMVRAREMRKGGGEG